VNASASTNAPTAGPPPKSASRAHADGCGCCAATVNEGDGRSTARRVIADSCRVIRAASDPPGRPSARSTPPSLACAEPSSDFAVAACFCRASFLAADPDGGAGLTGGGGGTTVPLIPTGDSLGLRLSGSGWARFGGGGARVLRER
jgi:hypothetical protein